MIVQGYIQSSYDWSKLVNPGLVVGKVVNVYLLAKEGVSNPRILNSISKPLIWTKKAIQSLADKVKIGIQAFSGHGATNDHNDRTPIGEIVGSATIEHNGNLHHYVAVSSANNHNYDVISMEANLTFDDNGSTGIVNQVLELTGLALGRRGIDIPGIEGTERVAQMQYFENITEVSMTLEEVKKIIRENGWTVTSIFPTSQIMGKIKIDNGQISYDGDGTDPAIGKVINKYVLEQLNPILKEQKEKISDYEPKIKEYLELKNKSEKAKALTKIKDIISSRALTQNHEKYLESVMDEYEPNAHKFDDFVENKLSVYKKLVEVGLISNVDGGEQPPKPNQVKPTKTWEEELKEIKK